MAESLELEVALRSSVFVREVVVEAGESGTTVVIEPIFATLERWAQNRGITFATVRSLVRSEEVVDHLRDEVLRAGADLGMRSIDRLVVLDQALESVPGALSSSGRVRREVVLAEAKDAVDA